MKNTFSLLLFLAFLLQNNPSQAQKADDIIGVWRTDENAYHIEIVKDAETHIFTGTIVWLKEPTDKEGNPKKDPHNKVILGTQILSDFTFDTDDWSRGEIYDPELGEKYFCTISMVNIDKIKIQGAEDPMGKYDRTAIWKRVVE